MSTWTFGPAEDSTDVLADGTQLPHRRQVVYLDGQPVGEIEIHLHRRYGPDKQLDLSYGITVITYGPLSPRATPDSW